MLFAWVAKFLVRAEPFAGPVEVVLQSLWSQTNFEELEGLLVMVLSLQAPWRTAGPVEDAKKAFVPGCCC